MNVVTEFCVGELYTNDQIRLSLGLENLGGIRPSVDGRRNLIHLAVMTAADGSDRLRAENPYHDRIENNILLYTAQGREGDQQLTGRNRRLTDQYLSPVPYFGFSNVGKQMYRFLGLLELLRHYQERQADKSGKMRKVWLFEFLIHREPPVVPISEASTLSAGILARSKRENPLGELEREVTELGEAERSSGPESAIDIEGVRSHLFQLHPYRFEHLVRHVMEVNGFCRVNVTAASGDNGIDVNGYVEDENDFFAGTHVQVQVKRWRHAVGSVEINQFRGALSTTAKGVFITTSQYTKAAIIEANHQSKLAVTLIDGSRLAAIILRDNIDLGRFS